MMSQALSKHLTLILNVGVMLVAAFVVDAVFANTTQAQARRAGARPRVHQLEEIRIEGTVQKPNAFYILNRSSIGYEVLDLRNTFTREVVRSVQREPF